MPLDHVLLGRPLQAFEAIATLLSQHVTANLQQTGHRCIALQVEAARFLPLRPEPGTAANALRVELSRGTVQAHMAARYGLTDDAAGQPLHDGPPSATELRITTTLQAAIAQAVHAVLPAQAPSAVAPCSQLWQWQATIRIGHGAAHDLRVQLGSACSQQLEYLVAQQRKPWRQPAGRKAPLLVDLQALLLEKTVTAADIQALRVDSVLPISLARARVTLNGQAMLTASVAEHQGKLHLTAFENLD